MSKEYFQQKRKFQLKTYNIMPHDISTFFTLMFLCWLKLYIVMKYKSLEL